MGLSAPWSESWDYCPESIKRKCEGLIHWALVTLGQNLLRLLTLSQ